MAYHTDREGRTLHDVPTIHHYMVVIGPAGAAIWTTQPDLGGWYWSHYFKPTGKGARTGGAHDFKYVPRMSAKRRTRKACMNRGFNLADGLPITTGVKKKPKRVNPPGTGWCMRERKHVIMENLRTTQAKNGRKMITGDCPGCGQIIHKYGSINLCPECGERAEMAADDYICKACRGA